MTASARFTAAHAAARLADALVAYRTRFTTALKSAWAAAKAAAKQATQTTMKKIIATITGRPYADGLAPSFDVFHQATEQRATAHNPARTTLFTFEQPLYDGDVARFVLFSTEPADRRSPATVTLNGIALYARTGEGLKIESLDNERTQQAYGFSAEDAAAFKQAANL